MSDGINPTDDPTPPTDPIVSDPKDDKVPKSAYEEVKNDLHKFKNASRQKEAELEQMKNKLKELELAGMRAKEDYKAMYETEKTEKEDYKSKYERTNQAVIDSAKWNQVSQELVKAGINPSSLRDVERLIDFNEIDVEVTSHGRTNVLNAKQVAETFKASRPYFFQTGGKPNVNTTTPTVITSANVTIDSIKAAEAEWKKNRTPETERKYKDALVAFKQRAQ